MRKAASEKDILFQASKVLLANCKEIRGAASKTIRVPSSAGCVAVEAQGWDLLVS